jgi:sarcosine oxidase subunit beta
MSLYSIDFFRNWDADCGYDPKGYLFFTADEKRFDVVKENIRKQRQLGVEDVEVLDADTISTIVPGMNCTDIVGGSFRQADGFIDPVAVMENFTERALQRGVQIEFDVSVSSINETGGKVRSVSTNKGERECGAVVLCAGAWARDLAATAGIDLPVEPLRRQIVWGQTKDDLPPELPMVIDLDCGFHFRPGREFGKRAAPPSGRDILFAFPDPDEKPSFETEFDESFIKKVREKAKHRAEFLFETKIVREKCRAGLYENTPDHHAILGGCGIEGL